MIGAKSDEAQAVHCGPRHQSSVSEQLPRRERVPKLRGAARVELPWTGSVPCLSQSQEPGATNANVHHASPEPNQCVRVDMMMKLLLIRNRPANIHPGPAATRLVVRVPVQRRRTRNHQICLRQVDVLLQLVSQDQTKAHNLMPDSS